MKKCVFESEFSNRFGRNGFKITPFGDVGDFLISKRKIPGTLFVRTLFPVEKEASDIIRCPSPEYNVEAVLYFSLIIGNADYVQDYIILIYENPVQKRTDFLIIKTVELLNRLRKMSEISYSSDIYTLLIWIFPGDFVFAATDLSGEGEWYLLGSGLAKGSERDFSEFLNCWDEFKNYFRFEVK